MSMLRQDTRLTLLSRIPVLVLSLLSMTLLTRWLGPEGNGVYTFILTNINLLLLLIGLQSETAVLHFMSRPSADTKSTAGLALTAVAVSTLGCAILLALAGYFVPFLRDFLTPEGQPIPYFLWFILLSFLLRKSQNTFLAIQRATLAFKAYTTYQLWAQIIPAGLYLYGFVAAQMAATTQDLMTIFNFILLGQALVTAIGAVMIFAGQQMSISFHFKSLIKPFYTFSFKTTLDAIAKFINRRVDVYFVESMKGMGSLGQYGLASQINNFAQEAILPFTQVMTPYLVRSDEHERVAITTRMTRIIVTLTALLALAIMLLAPLMIPLIFGKAFTGAIAATQILSITALVITLRIGLSVYFQSGNRLRFNIQSNWLAVVVTILLDLLLIPGFGIEGAAWASVLAYTTSLLFLLYHFMQQTHARLSEILLLRKSDIGWLLSQQKH